MFNLLARPSAGIGVKTHGFFAMFNLLARPSAGIGVVEVQKLEVFCDFCGARATLCGDRRGRGAKTRGFCDFCCSNWSSGVVSWFARLLPEPAGRGFDSSLVRGRASQDATCILKQLASNLRRASCTEQLAQTNLHRPVCAEHLAWCCLALASQMLRVGKKNASCSVGPTSLAMFCFRANRGLVATGQQASAAWAKNKLVYTEREPVSKKKANKYPRQARLPRTCWRRSPGPPGGAN